MSVLSAETDILLFLSSQMALVTQEVIKIVLIVLKENFSTHTMMAQPDLPVRNSQKSLNALLLPTHQMAASCRSS
ncbi:MAG: hypothetical protein DHS20C13_28500 [Thermodesulfobacteriota bacterium]|nr:MAG: hypothetical protein DHS20C13_28500 [Thermodesulfobacteriota bacterium]